MAAYVHFESCWLSFLSSQWFVGGGLGSLDDFSQDLTAFTKDSQ